MSSIMNDGLLGVAALTVLATCAGLLVIALLRPIVRRLGGAVAVLRLWWILPLAIAAIALPRYALVTIKLAPVSHESIAGTPAVHAGPLVQAAHIVQPSPQDQPFAWKPALLAIWLAGAALAAARLLRSQTRFARSITWTTARRGILPRNTGPAVVGAFAPRLAIPEDFATRYSQTERRLMLVHEAIHLRRRDGLANLAMSMLWVLQWFNPLMYWAARAIASDQESACDAVVIARHPHALRIYANALLKTHPEVSYLPLVCRWHAYHPTVERISMLKSHRDAGKHRKLAATLLASGAALASAMVYAIGPATPATVLTPIEARLTADQPIAFDIITAVATPRQPAVPLAPIDRPAAPTPPAASEAPRTAPETSRAVPRAKWDIPSPISFRFQDINLRAAMQSISQMASVKFTGLEQLEGVRLNVSKRNVLLGPFVRVMMDCAGFAIEDDGVSYAIVPKPAVSRQDNISACVDAGITEAPEPIASYPALPVPPGPRYKLDLKVYTAADRVSQASSTLSTGQMLTLTLENDTSIECMPIWTGGIIALGCRALPSAVASWDTTSRDVRHWSDAQGKWPRFLRRVEFGKADTEDLVIDGKVVTVHYSMNKL
jgi:beta-lactamase regulating signal transducer with metallopeptidase domain